MITKLVKRYYCEFCRKGGQTKAIQSHEDSCIYNPSRKCFICREYKFEQKPMDDLIAAAEGGVHDLWQVTDCPCCVLSAIVQRRKIHPTEEFEGFDYKEAMNELRNRDFNPGF